MQRSWTEYDLRGPMMLRANAGERCAVYGDGVGPGGAYLFARSAGGAEGLVLREWVGRDSSPAAPSESPGGKPAPSSSKSST